MVEVLMLMTMVKMKLIMMMVVKMNLIIMMMVVVVVSQLSQPGSYEPRTKFYRQVILCHRMHESLM